MARVGACCRWRVLVRIGVVYVGSVGVCWLVFVVCCVELSFLNLAASTFHRFNIVLPSYRNAPILCCSVMFNVVQCFFNVVHTGSISVVVLKLRHWPHLPLAPFAGRDAFRTDSSDLEVARSIS